MKQAILNLWQIMLQLMKLPVIINDYNGAYILVIGDITVIDAP